MSTTINELQTLLAEAKARHARHARMVQQAQSQVADAERAMYAAYEEAHSFWSALRALGHDQPFDPWEPERKNAWRLHRSRRAEELAHDLGIIADSVRTLLAREASEVIL